MIKTLSRTKLKARPITILPGDTLTVTYKDKRTEEKVLDQAEIDVALEVNTIEIFQVQDEFGLEMGIGSVIGRSKDDD